MQGANQTAQPRPGAASSQRQSSGRARSIADGFRGELPRGYTSFGHFFSLVLISLGMLLLVAAFFSVIAAICYALYWHAQNNNWLAAGEHASGLRSSRLKIAYVFVFIVPFIIGSIAIFFLIKPIFTRRRVHYEPLTLDRAQDPELYAVLEEIARRVKVPMPKRIEVHCDVSASVMLSGFFSRGLVLHLGLPLIAGLSTNEFVGVLAHELGHFRGRLGIRLRYLNNRLNRWFIRVAYERDGFDEEMQSYGEGEDDNNIIWLLILLTRPIVWACRKIMVGLAYASHYISFIESRQSEFKCDAVGAAVVGSSAMTAMLRKLEILSFAQQRCYQDLSAAWREQRLPDNFPQLVVTRASEMPETSQDALLSVMASQSQAKWHDTHPLIPKRVAALEAKPVDGIFDFPGPATRLLKNFKMVACAVTIVYYRKGCGLNVDQSNLVATDALVEQHAVLFEEQGALDRVGRKCINLYLPPVLCAKPLAVSSKPKADLARLKEVHQKIDQHAKRFANWFEAFSDQLDRQHDLAMADAFLRIGVKLDKKQWKLPSADRAGVAQARSVTDSEIDSLRPRLQSMNALQAERIRLALQLALLPQVRQKIGLTDEDVSDLKRIWPVLRACESACPSCIEVRQSHHAAAGICRAVEEDGDRVEAFDNVAPVARSLARRVTDHFTSLEYDFDGLAYPFEHQAGEISTKQFLFGATGITKVSVGSTVAQADVTFDRLFNLYSRCLMRVAMIVEKVEKATRVAASQEKQRAAD